MFKLLYKKYYIELEKKLNILEETINSCNKREIELSTRIDDLEQCVKHNPIDNNECEFDIENLDVFCIEISDGYTLISYLLEGKLTEHYIKCSPEKHKEFVSRFRSKLNLD